MTEPAVREAMCPDPDCSLEELMAFGLSYNGYERLGRSPVALGDVVDGVVGSLEEGSGPPEEAGVDMLRGALFFLQRQSAHWGRCPPEQERKMRKIMEAIRARADGLVLASDDSVGGRPTF